MERVDHNGLKKDYFHEDYRRITLQNKVKHCYSFVNSNSWTQNDCVIYTDRRPTWEAKTTTTETSSQVYSNMPTGLAETSENSTLQCSITSKWDVSRYQNPQAYSHAISRRAEIKLSTLGGKFPDHAIVLLPFNFSVCEDKTSKCNDNFKQRSRMEGTFQVVDTSLGIESKYNAEFTG